MRLQKPLPGLYTEGLAEMKNTSDEKQQLFVIQLLHLLTSARALCSLYYRPGHLYLCWLIGFSLRSSFLIGQFYAKHQ